MIKKPSHYGGTVDNQYFCNRTKEIKELSNGKSITLELFIERKKYEQIKKSFWILELRSLQVV